MHAESKKSIQRKAIAAILLAGIIPSLIVVVLTYLTSINALKNSIGANFQELATETADKIQIFMNMTIKNAKSLALAPVIVDAVSRTNRSYIAQERGLKPAYAPISGLDLQRPFSVSEYLEDYQRQRIGEYGSILVTDSKGYVVKAINGPAERYHGEKDWWMTAYNQGRGRDYIGGIEYDKNAQTYSLAIAVPVHGKGAQKVIGVLKMTYSVKEIFNAVNMIKIGKTGHANLVTSDGTLVVCPIYPPESHRINDRLTRQISTGKPGWGIAADDAHGGKDSIIGFAPVASTLRADAGYFGTKAWYIFIRQLPDETYAPMYALLWKVSLLVLSLLIALPLLGLFAARRIIRPIGLLIEGAGLIGQGRMDHRISIKTGDEIEKLADTFNQMAENLDNNNKEMGLYLHRLKESEEQYKALFDHSEDSMLILDLEGTVVDVNMREEEVLGYLKESLLGRIFSTMLPEKGRETFKALLKDTLGGEKAPTAEIEVLSRSHGMLTMETNLRGIKKGGNTVFIQVHMRDITKRKILEEEIKLERDKLETIIESMEGGLDIVDRDFRIRYLNEKFLKLFGKEAVGKTCYKIYAGRERPCDECPVVKGIEKIGVLEVNALDGRTYLVTHSPIRNLDGTVSILEIFTDITERKNLERAIRESEERYKTLFDHSEDSMLMVDPHGRIAAVNKREEEIIGYTKDKLIGRDFSEIVHEDERKTYRELFQKSLTDEKPPTTEFRIVGRDRGILTMEVDLTAIERGGETGYVQVHIRNITKRKELEQQLLRSERLAALGHFSSTLVHDLRNPIIGIKKRLEALQRTIKSSRPEETARVLTDIILGSGLLIGMVNDVLDIYQNSYEDLPLIISAFPLAEALEESAKLLQIEAEERHTSIIIQEGGQVSIQGDKRRLQRVFINLLHNAIKFSPPNGKVLVSFYPAGEDGAERFIIKIEDEGPGILPSELPWIFEPFHRKGGNNKTAKSGTGLGLYFCKVVVELHQGNIWVENRDRGTGAVFFIKIPFGKR